MAYKNVADRNASRRKRYAETKQAPRQVEASHKDYGIDLGQWMHRNPLFRMYSMGTIRLYIPGNRDATGVVSLSSGHKPITRDGLAALMWNTRESIRRTV